MSELVTLTAEVGRFCREHALAEDVEFDLDLVLEELFTNAVRHGGCDGVSGAVRVALRARPGGVFIEFADRGEPFHPDQAPAPDLNAPLEERRVGGLGIHLVRQIVRNLHYERAAGWNRLTMLRPTNTEVPK